MENDFQKMNLSCISCDNVSIHHFCKKNLFDLYRCSNCGLIFVWPLPKDTSNIYSADYFRGAKKGFGYVDYDKDKSAMSATFLNCLKRIDKLLQKKGKLLDVGAATGYFLEIAKIDGWDTCGVEISDYAAEKARAKGLDVKTGTLRDINLESESFDLVTMWDVIEHLSNPKSELKKVHPLLKKGGLVAINTPDTGSLFARLMGKRWHLLVPPDHLVYFNSGNLSKLLNEQGFSIVSISRIGKKFTLQYIFQTLARWQKLFLWQWAADFFSTNSIGKASVPLNLRDNFFIIARKI